MEQAKQQERQSNFELIKILAMFMIVAHHFIAKNAFNVDTEIVGISFNKVFLQFIGNHAFIGNNLFFMCSAYFLIDKSIDVSTYPRKQIKRIWFMEKPMLFYAIGMWLLFRFFVGGTANLNLLAKSLLPMSTKIWWYPTTYAVFLLIQPFYQLGLDAMDKDTLKKLIVVMFCIWSVSTLIPFFDYEPTNLICFILLYAIVYRMKKYGLHVSKKACRLIILAGYVIAAISIVALDLIGKRYQTAGNYACYFIRGNYRFLPMVISIAIFLIARDWNLQSKVINYIASLTFGIYLIHMYPLMMDWLFSNKGSLFDISRYISNSLLPVYAVCGICICFAGCAAIELIRKSIDSAVSKGIKALRN